MTKTTSRIYSESIEILVVDRKLTADMVGEAKAFVVIAVDGTIDLPLAQARELGKWLCARADEFEPITPVARIKKAIRWRLGR